MDLQLTLLLAVLFFLGATLYSSAGHGGASAYLAIMALAGLAPETMKPTALALNIWVAGLGTLRYTRAEQFCWRTFWPFALAAVPLAFVGGRLMLPADVYRPIVGLVLLVAAARLIWSQVSERPTKPAPLPLALACGGGIGLLSGLTGVGGGIFLSPLLVLAGWATTRSVLGVAAAFILLNSIAGLAGNWASVGSLPPQLPVWIAAVVLGGLVGTELGTRRLGVRGLRLVLVAVLIVAAGHLAGRPLWQAVPLSSPARQISPPRERFHSMLLAPLELSTAITLRRE